MHVSTHKIARSKRGALVDRGANGGILGCDATVLVRYDHRRVDVTGIDNHEMGGLTMVDAYAKTITQKGPIIVLLNQYAYHGVHTTIHSAPQIEVNRNFVDDRSMKCGGKQCIRLNDGYVIPINIINGLPYMPMCPATREEFDSLPHANLTSHTECIVDLVDNMLSNQDDWYNIVCDTSKKNPILSPFDEYGKYRHREPPTAIDHLTGDFSFEDNPDQFEQFSCEHVFRETFRTLLHVNDVYMFVHDAVPADQLAADPISVTPPIESTAQTPNYERFRPYFLHVPAEKVRKTFDATTQFAGNIISGKNILQTLKAPYPALNVPRRNEPVATDTVFAEEPAYYGGATMAQIFVGRKSLVVDIFGMTSEKQFVNTLEDIIRKRGAMDKLISDSARVEISNRVLDILRAYCIPNWQSEPNYQHQNFAEHRWNHVKRNLNWYMNWRNVPPQAWLLCLTWVADVMNHTAEKSLGDKPPLEILTGKTIDISALLCFLFWDVVYVERYEDSTYHGQPGSVKSSEIRGHFVGFAWNVGHALTFKVLTDDTRKVIHRSRLRLAKEMENNLKLDVEAGAVPERFYIRAKHEETEHLPTIDIRPCPILIGDPKELELPHDIDQPSSMDGQRLKDRIPVETIDPEEELAEHQKRGFDTSVDTKFTLNGLKTINPTIPNLSPEEMVHRSFLMPPGQDGSRVRAKIIEIIGEHWSALEEQPEHIRFRCLIDNDYEEIVAYNDIMDFIEADDGEDGMWKFRRILQHKKVSRSDPDYKGSSYNLLLEWETGECSWEPLQTSNKTGIADLDPVTVAIYAKEQDLLGKPGWNSPRLKNIAKTQKKLIRLANQTKLHSFRTKPTYKYGFLVPRNHDQAMEIDQRNGNSLWRDAEIFEIKATDEHKAFIDKGKGYNPGSDYKKIRVHFVYDVKHDGRHRARLVAGGHLTETPIDSVYAGVVSLRGIRILAFLACLNEMEFWACDIGSAYLESYTKEKVYIIAGPEFGNQEGHTLIISKALYGLKSSGARWHERLADVLRSMNFFPCYAESDIWMRDMGDHYEYIGVYVDDLAIASRNPETITQLLSTKHEFKLKGVNEVTYHLGCDFFRDHDGNLCYAPLRYIDKLIDNYVRLFGCKPKQATSPLVKNDHPELDTSVFLELDKIPLYQSLVGAIQWVVQIGRFDVTTAIMTLSRFRAAPRQGHLDRIKRIYGYLSKMRFGTIRIRTDEPDFSDIPMKEFDWFYTAYSGATEEIPMNLPKPRGKPVVTSSFVDANLYHDMVSGRSVTGCLHFLNKTPIDWYSKLQTTVETATYGSEFIAAKTCTDQIIELRNTLRYLGVPIKSSSFMFGDNESVVNSSSLPEARLHKRHNALAFHRTREAIAAKILRFHYVSGKTNPADILSKHWDMPSVWHSLRPILFSAYNPTTVKKNTKPVAYGGADKTETHCGVETAVRTQGEQ
jgi:Reverse transcriptase (RNA-dependent DNA polymerase)